MNDLINLRKELHQSPELSSYEVGTQKILLEFLKKFKPSNIIHLADNKALLVEFDSGKAGRNILYRADLDALPVPEQNDFSYASKNAGVAHKCGHDGHMTLACSLPEIWQKQNCSGKLGLLFQHAEEIAVGAKEVMEDEAFHKWKPDIILGLHNLPGHKTNEIVFSEDIFSCASMGLRISFTGTSSHAGEPEKAVSPYSSLLKITEVAQTLISPQEDDKFSLSTLVHMKMGEENYGITPGKGIVCFTLRAKRTEVLLDHKNFLRDKATELAAKNNLSVDFEEFDYFPATKNSTTVVKELVAAGKKAQLDTIEKTFPFRWSEDFGFFSDVCPTAYFGIGNGESSFPLHHPQYDFNDNVIESFQKLFKSFFSGIPGKK